MGVVTTLDYAGAQISNNTIYIFFVIIDRHTHIMLTLWSSVWSIDMYSSSDLMTGFGTEYSEKRLLLGTCDIISFYHYSMDCPKATATKIYHHLSTVALN